jgi:hypothetical protein
MKKLLTFLFGVHFHTWTKWERFTKEFVDYVPPFGKFGKPERNWYGYKKLYIQQWEKRECAICGEHREREI